MAKSGFSEAHKWIWCVTKNIISYPLIADSWPNCIVKIIIYRIQIKLSPQ